MCVIVREQKKQHEKKRN